MPIHTTPTRLLLAFTIFFLPLVVGAGPATSHHLGNQRGAATDDKRDQSCKLYRTRLVEEHPFLGEEDDFRRIEVFYSRRLATCLAASESLIRNEFLIRDISRGFLRPSVGDPIITPGVFDCSSDGVNNVLIEAVEKRGGYVFTVPYSEWMDDFAGGPPATIRTPARKFTREECEILFRTKLKEVR